MATTFSDYHITTTVECNPVWIIEIGHNPNWGTKTGGVRVHSYAKGTTADCIAIHINMEPVLALPGGCVADLIPVGGYHVHCSFNRWRQL